MAIIHTFDSVLCDSSIYQDIPLYMLDDFLERAPEEMRTEEIVDNEHGLMLSRLSFELAERQR